MKYVVMLFLLSIVGWGCQGTTGEQIVKFGGGTMTVESSGDNVTADTSAVVAISGLHFEVSSRYVFEGGKHVARICFGLPKPGMTFGCVHFSPEGTSFSVGGAVSK